MKLGILTHYNVSSHGALLQMYALQCELKQLGHDVYILEYSPNYDFIDDEKPLYVATDGQLRITGFHDSCENDRYISGGIYCLRPNAFETLERCMAEGKSRMRNFQRGLVEDGLRLKACPFSKILDVDHADDIRKAEEFLAAEDK